MASNSPATKPSIADALNRLWIRFLPEIEGRITILETASQALANSSLTDEQREEAHAAAHKLSGTLGTFGLDRGTELARRAELEFEKQSPSVVPAELTAWISELGLLVRSRQ